MFESEDINGTSLFGSLDPRVKILIAAGFSIEIAVCSRWAALIPGLLVSLLWILLSGIPAKKVLSSLIPANGFILFIWFFIPFSFEGTSVFSIGPFTASHEGILYALVLTVRSNIILLALICMAATTSVFTLARAMRQLGLPHKLVQLFFFTYRYLHVIHLEYHRMMNALKIRCFQPKTNLHTYKTYAYLVGMLVVRSYERSERVQNAMICRGFTGRFHSLHEYHLKSVDICALLLMSAAIGGIALFQWTTILI